MGFICIVIFNLSIRTFMNNSSVFSCFLTFLDEEGLLCEYLKARFQDSSFDLYGFGSFFKEDPSRWVTTAFLWIEYKSVNWHSVNERWLARLAFIEKCFQTSK